jgi:uncharacterized membrane protein YuzA (DUF378 family)
MLVGLSGIYLTIKHFREEAEKERMEAEQAKAAPPVAEEK